MRCMVNGMGLGAWGWGMGRGAGRAHLRCCGSQIRSYIVDDAWGVGHGDGAHLASLRWTKQGAESMGVYGMN
ncbi:MAG: hypothetical protein R2744_09315 [Bacteroidales bacterium]